MWKELIKIWKSQSLLDQAWKESFEMLEIDRSMFLEAVRILRESDDCKVDQDIRKLDQRVNKYEREVRRKVMTHCTIEGTSELPSGMVLVSVVIDIERVGDYCKKYVEGTPRCADAVLVEFGGKPMCRYTKPAGPSATGCASGEIEKDGKCYLVVDPSCQELEADIFGDGCKKPIKDA